MGAEKPGLIVDKKTGETKTDGCYICKQLCMKNGKSAESTKIAAFFAKWHILLQVQKLRCCKVLEVLSNYVVDMGVLCFRHVVTPATAACHRWKESNYSESNRSTAVSFFS